jgi:hypothetical protein
MPAVNAARRWKKLIGALFRESTTSGVAEMVLGAVCMETSGEMPP